MKLTELFLLLTGINFNDYLLAFELLRENLGKNMNVIVLNSKEITNTSKIITNISNQIITNEMLKDMKRQQLNNYYTFEMIINLYKQNTKNVLPLVLIFDDLQGIHGQTLKEFVLIIREHIKLIPIILIFGTTTVYISLKDFFPSNITDYLLIQTFSSAPSTQVYDQFVYDVFIKSPVPFKVGPEVIGLFNDIFLLYDFSLENCKHLLKQAMFEHYYLNTSSILCQSVKSIKKTVKSFSKDEFKALRKLPSLNSFEKTNDTDFRKQLIELSENIILHHENFVSELMHFYYLMDEFDNNPFGRNFQELYIIALSKKPILETDHFKIFISMINLLTCDEWEDLFERYFDKIEKLDFDQNSPFINTLKVNHEKLCELNVQNSEHTASNGVSNPKIDFSNCTTRSQWKEKLKTNMNVHKKNLSPFDKWKEEAIKSIKQIAEVQLKSPLLFSLNEVFYFNDLSVFKTQNLPSQRNEIKSDLTHSSHSLLNSDIHFDLNIVFKLLMENSTTFSLYDLFDNFKSLKLNSSRKMSKSQQQHIIACFLTCIYDLEYCGFVKISKKNNDQIVKLVWI